MRTVFKLDAAKQPYKACRIPGFFTRSEIGQALDCQHYFYIEEAGATDYKASLFAIYLLKEE